MEFERAMPLVLALVLTLGRIIGEWERKRMCAKAAISDSPPDWWRKALIDARARVEKEAVK